MSDPNNFQSPAQSPGAIDVAVLLDRCMDDGALALLVLAKFEEQAADNLKLLSQCVGARNGADAAKRAHALRGTAGAIGAVTLTNAAAQLEELALEGAMAQTEDCLATLKREVDRCLAQLPSVRQTLSQRTA